MGALRRRFTPYLLIGPGAIWLVLFFVVPLYYLARLSLESGVVGDLSFTWHWANYEDALSLYRDQFVRSFVYALAATAAALLLAYPLAYTIAFKAGRWRNLLLFAVIAPFFTTYLVRTLAWETILADQSPAVDLLQLIGIVPDDGRALATGPAVVAGLTYNFLPFMVLPIYASLERLDVRLIEAANDLYASSVQAFWRVTLPLSAPGIVAGTLLTFIPASGDYINAQFLGSASNQMIGNVIQALYLRQADYPSAAALSFVLMAMIMAAVLVYIRFAGSEALMGEEAR